MKIKVKNDKGEWKNVEVKFQKLNAEFLKSQRLIKDQFDAFKDESQASFFLKRTLIDLKILAKSVESDKDVLGYADIKKLVNALIKHIKSKYTDYIKTEEAKDKEPKLFILKGRQTIIKDTATNLHNSLELKKYLDKDCKKDFIKLFTGQSPLNKITWLGNKNELKLFINLLISEQKIEDCKNKKWQITAANFKFNDGDFTAKKINDFKPPKDKSKIEGVVFKISH